MKTCLPKNLCVTVYISVIHNSQKAEIIQIQSIDEWINKM